MKDRYPDHDSGVESFELKVKYFHKNVIEHTSNSFCVLLKDISTSEFLCEEFRFTTGSAGTVLTNTTRITHCMTK